MKNKCITNSFGNSISFNPEKDDLTMRNYIALTKCIVGIKTENGFKYPNVSDSCKAYGLYDLNREKRVGRTIVAANMKTNEIIEFEKIKDVSEFLDYKICTLRTYIDTPKRANKIWKLTYK